MSGLQILWIAHLMATMLMFGLIWMVQVVHYPLFAVVPAEGFEMYARRHVRQISFIVMPAMLLELLGTFMLSLWPEGTAFFAWRGALWWVAAAALGVNWLSTVAIFMPLHTALTQKGKNTQHIRAMVRWNWLRTASWSVRAALLLYITLHYWPL